MANPIPASYFPRRKNDSDASSNPVSADRDDVIGHDQTGDEPMNPSPGTRADGADAGTKGTGSAG